MEESRSLSITPCTRVGVLTVYGFAMSKFLLAVLGELLYMPEHRIACYELSISAHPQHCHCHACHAMHRQREGSDLFDTRENQADIVIPLVLSVCSATNRVLNGSHATRKSSW